MPSRLSDVSTLVQRGQEGGVSVRFVPSNLTAPVRAGQQVGVAVVSQGGQQIGRSSGRGADRRRKTAVVEEVLAVLDRHAPAALVAAEAPPNPASSRN